jgi:hypothetical protein
MMLVEDDLIDFAWSWRRRRPDLEIADMLDTVTEINRICVVVMKKNMSCCFAVALGCCLGILTIVDVET